MGPTRPAWRKCLPPLLNKLVDTYERLQVELHGTYSLERVAHVHAFERTHSTAQCVLVLLVTPLPCLAVIILTDLVPLNPPQDGYSNNRVFWGRFFVVAFALIATTFEQVRRLVLGLPISTRTLWIVSMAIAACTTGYGYLVATLAGFPIPFTFVLCAPSFTGLVVAAWYTLWGARLRESAQLRQEVIAYIKIIIVQIALSIVYSAYNFVFGQLTGFEQTLVALLLPILKLLAKNVISVVFGTLREDFKPEVVIFNVEVFHALFVSCCMQSSTSWTTTIVLGGADFSHAWFSLHDVDTPLRTILALETNMRRAAQDRACVLDTKSPIHELTMIEKAVYYVHHDDAVRKDPVIRVRSVRALGIPNLVAVFSKRLVGPSAATTTILGADKTLAKEREANNVNGEAPTHRVRPVHTNAPMQIDELDRLSSMYSHLPEETQQMLHTLTTQERVTYVTTTLQVLYITEFLLLIEFVEVIIPVVYCVYLTAMFYLPNRAFYPDLAQMDAQSLLSTIGNVLGYAALEFVSFVGLCMALRRRLPLSPLHQLAFVLHSQWHLVQSQLIMWVMFAVQISLQHFGYDFSFQFQWLRAE